ncbi:hypothetical protein NX821_001151 [Clostridium septicum]|uniref:hypothetical protein n=1 Tax=Clostridium septicum TaxID=1504 RepID=UPI00321712BB
MEQIKGAESLIDKLFELNEEDPELLRAVWNKKSGIKSDIIRELYDKLVHMHENPNEYKNVKAKTRGTLLEELIKQMTIKTKSFELFENITNDTNEYDIIIKTSDLARRYAYNALPRVIFQPIICECKNYQSTIDVTWIGKFYSLLSISNINMGIIFSYEGVTGQAENDWANAWGLIRKIYLKDGIAIISISRTELDRIVAGENFCDILEEKFIELQTMTTIENEKRYHSSEVRVKKLLDKIEEESKKSMINNI